MADFVFAEIDADGVAHEHEDLVERALIALLSASLAIGDIGMTAQARELAGELGNREHIIDDAGVDGAVGHAAKLRRLGLLREGDAVLRFDRLEPLGAVGRGSREDDADRVAAAIGGEGAKKEVDRQVRLARLVVSRKQRQEPVKDADVRVRRDDVDVIGLDLLAILGLA